MTRARQSQQAKYEKLVVLGFPFFLENLLVILLFTVLFTIACIWASLPVGMGLRSIGFWFICITLFFNYIFVIVDYTSRGMQRVPKLSGEMVFPTHDSRLYTIAVLTICYVAFIFGSWQSSSLATRLIISFFSYPLMFSLLIVHQQFSALLNPINLIRTLYLFSLSTDAVVFYICQILTGSFMYFEFTSWGQIAFAHIFWQVPVTLILLFITFRALGVALNTRGPSFGLSVLENEETFKHGLDETARIDLDRFILKLHRWTRVHEYNKAFEMITDYQSEHGHSRDDALFVRLTNSDNRRLAAMLGAQLAERMLLEGETARALKVFRESYDMAPAKFRFSSGTLAHAFLDAAHDEASKQRLRACLVRFDDDFPGHPMSEPVKKKLHLTD